MVVPGLLPDPPEERKFPFRSIGVMAGLALLLLIFVWLQMSRVYREEGRRREELLAKMDQELQKALAKLAVQPASDAPLPVNPPTPPDAEVPARAPDVRVLPPTDRDRSQERIVQGVQEFRAGRIAEAEGQFFRALPDGYPYLVVTSLARRDYREALAFLSRAMALDRNWLRKIKPRDLFASEAAYLGVVQALEEHLGKNPLDADAKTLLAYLRYHDQGPHYAKGLLVEATNAKPDHEEARSFLEALER